MVFAFHYRFISAIIEEFRTHTHKKHVGTILKKANERMSKHQLKFGVTQGISEKSLILNKLKHRLFLEPPRPLEAYKYGEVFWTILLIKKWMNDYEAMLSNHNYCKMFEIPHFFYFAFIFCLKLFFIHQIIKTFSVWFFVCSLLAQHHGDYYCYCYHCFYY